MRIVIDAPPLGIKQHPYECALVGKILRSVTLRQKFVWPDHVRCVVNLNPRLVFPLATGAAVTDLMAYVRTLT